MEHLFKGVFQTIVLLSTLLALFRCSKEPSAIETPPSPTPAPPTGLFTLLDPEQTNIDFVNTLKEGLNTNILMYEYFYNGGGVATGDLNGDDLIDIYFTSNMGINKLYLNKGNMKFQDVSTMAGAEGREGPWKTGVTMADVNGDNRLDLFVCYSGMLPEDKRINQLFVNEGNDKDSIPHFREATAEYGLATPAFSNQAYFFDYDHDGDLDMLLLNHNPKSLPVLNEAGMAAMLKKDDKQRGVRLFKQTDGTFKDVTVASGISGSALTYGLGLGISDINNDGWQDFYISNDYAVPDYLYVNNHDGTFTNKLQESIGHTSHFSMGNDVADINNDGWQDIVTLDMLPEDNHRQKLLMAPDNYEKFDLNIRSGFYYQYMRNMLQLNNGNGTFSEIGQLAGISNTDRSWAALLADYNNDGWKDLFVTNGFVRDYTNLDFIKYMDDYVLKKGRLQRSDVSDLVVSMPSSNVVNYIFSNNGGITFTDKTRVWGMDQPSNSNGASYADLDNDGDLDLIVNNINKPAFIYQNESNRNSDNHFLQVKLHGEGMNTRGIGAKLIITVNGKKQYLEQMNSRGFLSSVPPVLHFGLGKEIKADSLVVIWPRGKQQLITDIKNNQVLTLEERNAFSVKNSVAGKTAIFNEVPSPIKHNNPLVNVNDFKRQPLMVNPMSFFGPCMVKGDVNRDGRQDILLGGGSGQAAKLFLQQRDKKFKLLTVRDFERDKKCEDADAVFFDANGDGHTDVYIASGGYHHYGNDDPLLQDRLYLNDRKGHFIKSKNALPKMPVSKGCITAADFNGDGHPDLFVGGRVIPGRYPEVPTSYLLINNGKGRFTDKTETLAPQLQKIGMVTDAASIDLNKDGKKDLIVVGEWLAVSVFINVNGILQDKTSVYFDKPYSGLWNRIVVEDFNNDQKPDLLIGNMGNNAQFSASDQMPADLYYKDYDNNGSVDPIFCFYIQEKSYPYVTRDELLGQLGGFKQRFTSYKSFADATLDDLFTPEELTTFNHLQANIMETTLFLSNENEKFHIAALPIEVQYAPVFTITPLDFNKDGNKDVLLCGNINQAKLRLGKSDANYGVLLEGNGKGAFRYIEQAQSGFQLRGDVRSVAEVNNLLLFGIAQQKLIAYKINK